MSEKRNAVRQGITHSDSCTSDYVKLHVNASDKDATDNRDAANAKHMETSSSFLSALTC